MSEAKETWFLIAAFVGWLMIWWPSLLIRSEAEEKGKSNLDAAKLQLWGLASWPGFLIARRRLRDHTLG